MKITLIAAGSRGDVQPCALLGKGLQSAGYQVRLAAPQDFAAFVQELGVPFYPLRGDVQKLMASQVGRQFMGSGGANPLKSLRAIRTLIAPVMQRMLADADLACGEADALICLGVFAPLGKAIAEARRLPMLNLEPTPLLPTRAFPAASWPIQRNLGGAHNYLSGVLMLQVVWLWYRDHLNAFRRSLGLAAYSGRQFYQDLRLTPMLGAYSPTLIPHPPDWPPSLHVTGYLFADQEAGWQPPSGLTAFLERGDPPVYVGFGSMGGDDPQQLARLAFQALELSGQRGVLLTGWGGLRPGMAPASVYVLDAAPHRWLFPRMAALVHHGGAGTTAEGLRAGVPAVIVPFVFDQPFWGARLAERGLGPPPVPHKALTAPRLAQAIRAAVQDSGLRQRAQAAGARIRGEDGLGEAVKMVASYFGKP